MTTKAENFIHIKFEYFTARQCKRDMLSTEIDLVKMNKRLRVYIESRLKELEIKADLEKKLRALKLDLGRLQNLMPGIKIPKLLKSEKKEFKIEEKEKPNLKKPEILSEKSSETDDLDAQLQEIQKQLDALA